MRPLPVFALMLGCASSNATPALDDAHTGHDAGGEVATHDAHVEDTRRDARDAPPEIPPPPVPETLAETGLYSDFAARTLADGVMPFDVRYPLWSDGADKARYLLVPPGKQIDTADMDHWVYPVGTKSWKEFRVAGKLIETRYLEKTGEAPIGWRFVAYVWNAEGTKATAAKSGVANALGTEHDVPSQEQCEQCHSGTRDGLIGPGAFQLSAADGKGLLAQLASKGLLSTTPAAEYVPPGSGNVQEVLGYLHGNCGYCHSDEGRWATARALRLKLRVADKTPEETPTYRTTINVKMSHGDVDGNPYIAVVPGAPEKSHLLDRMVKRDFWVMPPVGTEKVDDAAVARVREWILSLK